MAIGGPDWIDLFEVLDSDVNGVLSYEELLYAVRFVFRLGEHLAPDGFVAALFRHLDTNGSGTIELEEFLAFMLRNRAWRVAQQYFDVAGKAAGVSDWGIVFDSMDTEQDGMVSFEELLYTLRDELHVGESSIPTTVLRTMYARLEPEVGEGIVSKTRLVDYIGGDSTPSVGVMAGQWMLSSRIGLPGGALGSFAVPMSVDGVEGSRVWSLLGSVPGRVSVLDNHVVNEVYSVMQSTSLTLFGLVPLWINMPCTMSLRGWIDVWT